MIAGKHKKKVCFFFTLTVYKYLFSGRSPASQTLDYVRKLGFNVDNEAEIPINHGITVTVPGAAAAWCDTVEKFGSGKVKNYKSWDTT